MKMNSWKSLDNIHVPSAARLQPIDREFWINGDQISEVRPNFSFHNKNFVQYGTLDGLFYWFYSADLNENLSSRSNLPFFYESCI